MHIAPHTTFPALPAPVVRCLAAAAVAACALLAGCDRNGPSQPPTPKADAATTSGSTSGSTTSAGNSNTAGVLPHSDSKLPASDRPGAPAVGAMEAGQAGSRGSAGAPAPTAGDGAASGAPASRPASGG